MTAAEREERTERADALCRRVFEDAVAGREDAGIALVAVGGYGRRELAPYSDLDVVVVHDPSVELGEVPEKVLYPLWDANVRLDHSVRALDEVTGAAAGDVRVALGLLDTRHLAGDTSVSLRLRADVLSQWRRDARENLPRLRDLVRARVDRVGELAHAAVPDLKESGGGLRDATVLKALVATWMVDVPHADLERCRLQLLDLRDLLQDAAGRATDRVAPELWSALVAGLPANLDLEEWSARGLEGGRRAALAASDRAPHRPPVTADLEPGRPRAGSGAAPDPQPGAAADPARPRRGAVEQRGGARPGRRPRCRPAARAAGRRGRRRARGGALPGLGRAPGRQLRPDPRALAGRGPRPAGAAAGLGVRAAGGLGDPRPDRRARPRAAGVATGPAAAARHRRAPLHRRPAHRRDLRRGLPADPAGGAPRPAAARRAAARHRQGRPGRPQRGRGAGGGRGRDPHGLRRRGRRRGRRAGAPPPAALGDRHLPRPRRPRHPGPRRAAGRTGVGAGPPRGAHRGRRARHRDQGLERLAGPARGRPRPAGARPPRRGRRTA